MRLLKWLKHKIRLAVGYYDLRLEIEATRTVASEVFQEVQLLKGDLTSLQLDLNATQASLQQTLLAQHDSLQRSVGTLASDLDTKVTDWVTIPATRSQNPERIDVGLADSLMKLHPIRVQLGLKAAEIAHVLGIPEADVRAAESKTRIPDPKACAKILNWIQLNG